MAGSRRAEPILAFSPASSKVVAEVLTGRPPRYAAREVAVSEDPNRNPFQGFRIEVDPERVEDALRELRRRISETFQASRHTRVRLSFRGRRLGPDIPLAVFLAGEGAAFWLLSPLTALLVNIGAKAILDVEFIHDADELVQEGLQAYLEGEIAVAEQKYREALRKRPDDPSALYNLGTLLRVSGRLDEARAALRRAAMGPEAHPDVVRASQALARLDPQSSEPPSET